MATNKLITVQQLDTAVDGFASAVAAAGYEKKANLKALAYVDEIADTHLASSITTVLAAKMTTAKAQELVDKNVGKAYKPGGNATLATLPAADAAHFGYVYNMTEEFTTTDNFIEGAGKIFTAGSEVAVVEAAVIEPNIEAEYWEDSETGEPFYNEGALYFDTPGTAAYTVGDVINLGYGIDRATGEKISKPGRIVKITYVYGTDTHLGGAYQFTDAPGETPTASLPMTYKYNVLSGYIDTTKFAAQSSFATVKAAVENLSIATNSDIQALINGLSLEEETWDLNKNTGEEGGNNFRIELIWDDDQAPSSARPETIQVRAIDGAFDGYITLPHASSWSALGPWDIGEEATSPNEDKKYKYPEIDGYTKTFTSKGDGANYEVRYTYTG